jgi:hypothetical protein
MENTSEPKDKHVIPVDYNGAEDAQAIYDLMEIMRTVKTKGKEAKLNATTINDGKGGRILL